MKEKIIFYLMMEAANYATIFYEVYIIGLSWEQSLVCRLFASLTDLIVLIFFFNNKGVWKKIWDPQKKHRTFKSHLMAGVKLLVQFPVIYFIKVIFVNSLVIPELKSWGIEIELIGWNNLMIAVVLTVIFCLLFGTLFSFLREKKLRKEKIFYFSFIIVGNKILKFKKAKF
jgi:hypothetical protein